MLSEARKQELIDELTHDLEKYINKQGLIENFIDSTCEDGDEVDFMRNVVWWVSVQDGGDYE